MGFESETEPFIFSCTLPSGTVVRLNERSNEFSLHWKVSDEDLLLPMSLNTRLDSTIVPLIKNIITHGGKLDASDHVINWILVKRAFEDKENPLQIIGLGKGDVFINDYPVMLQAKAPHVRKVSNQLVPGLKTLSNTQQGDFVLRDEGLPIPFDFFKQSSEARRVLKEFNIDFSHFHSEFNKGLNALELRDCVSFMRDVIYKFGEINFLDLIDLFALYRPTEEQGKEDFTKRSIVILREILGKGRSFSSAAMQPEVISLFPPQEKKSGRISFVRNNFYFWLIILKKLNPDELFTIPLNIRKNRGFSKAEEWMDPTLSRVNTALVVAQTICQHSEGLAKCGISIDQSKMWLAGILGQEEALTELDDDERSEIKRYRQTIFDVPNTVLSRASDNRLRKRMLKELPNRVLDHKRTLEDAGGELDILLKQQGEKQPIELRRIALIWFSNLTFGEKRDVLTFLFDYSSTKLSFRSNRSLSRKSIVFLLPVLRNILIEVSMGIAIRDVLTGERDYTLLFPLITSVREKISNTQLFSHRDKIIFSSIINKVSQKKGLTQKEVMILVLYASRMLFDANTFKQNFASIFQKQIPRYLFEEY